VSKEVLELNEQVKDSWLKKVHFAIRERVAVRKNNRGAPYELVSIRVELNRVLFGSPQY